MLSGQPEVAEGPYFLCWSCGVGRQPLRESLGLDSDGFTPALREMSVLAGILEPFESASEQVLFAVAGISVSSSKIHSLCNAAQTALADLHRYLDVRRHLLDYPATVAKGLPIGSGAAESAINHVLQQRMKRSGMRWKLHGARRMAALRCAYRSKGGLPAVFAEMRRAA